MFEVLDGETLEKPEWEAGIPSDILDIMDKLCDALDDLGECRLCLVKNG